MDGRALTASTAHTKAARYDINRLAEDVLIPVSKDVYGCHFLRNLNKEKSNFAGLDLGDEQSRIAFQVTHKERGRNWASRPFLS